MRVRVFKNQSSTGTMPFYRRKDSSVLWNRTDSYLTSSSFVTMEDLVTPNFKARQRAGEIILNPKTKLDWSKFEKATGIGGEGQDSYHWINKTYLLMQHCGVYDAYPKTLDEAKTWLSQHVDYDVSVAKAFSNVDVSEIQALASLGEMPETIRWISSIIERVLSLIRFFTRRKKRLRRLVLSRVDLLDSAANLWLEFRYAIRPLVFEMHSAVTALKSCVEKGSRKTARGWDRVLTTSQGTQNGYSDSTMTSSISYTTSLCANYRAGVLFDIESDINGILALWGFDQPLESVWELVPFSFIIDWFLNIGDIIAGWSVNPHLRILGNWVTVEFFLSRKYTMTNVNLFGFLYNVDKVWTPGTYQERAVISQRIISPQMPLLPSINLNLDWAKLLDLATIGRGLYKSFRMA